VVSDELITAAELLPLVGTDRIRVVDAREPSDYREGHIPGAVNLHPTLFEHIEVLESGEQVDHQLKPGVEVAAVLRAAGINNSVPVCVYDEGGGYLGARIWWILDYLGHSRRRLLDGGYFSWLAAAGPVDREPVAFAVGEFVLSPHISRRVEFSDVIATLGDPRTVLVNTLSRESYLSETIPGSLNIPYERTFAPDNHPLLKSRHELAAMFENYGVTASHHLILYCQKGYSACQVYVAARYAGLTNVSVYDGSKLDWVARGGELLPGEAES